MKDEFDYIGAILADDEALSILDKVILQKPAAKTIYNVKEAKEKEIVDFIKKNGHEPSLSSSDVFEKQLAMRAKAIRERREKELGSVSEEPENPWDTDEGLDILANVDLGNTSINDFSNSEIIRNRQTSERAESEFVSRAVICRDFAKYKPLFDDMKKALYSGHRKMVPFSKHDLRQGAFYVRQGLIFYVNTLFEQTKSKIREYDGRTHLIFDNGTESNVLVSTLRKSMYEDAYCITEDDRVDSVTNYSLEQEIAAPKFNTGFIYILNTLSQEPQVKQFKDLHKIGFTRESVSERIKNAAKETTYLCADVTVADQWECSNLNPQKLEDLIHKFFAAAQVRIRVKDEKGQFAIADEWYDVPISEIRKIVPFILDRSIGQYFYDSKTRSICRR